MLKSVFLSEYPYALNMELYIISWCFFVRNLRFYVKFMMQIGYVKKSDIIYIEFVQIY